MGLYRLLTVFDIKQLRLNHQQKWFFFSLAAYLKYAEYYVWAITAI